MNEPSVLIVENDPGAVEAFEPMLKNRGYTVRVANDASTGFREIGRMVPDAMLIDLHLPDVNGVEFLRQIRSTPSGANIPAALITGDYLLEENIVSDVQILRAKIYFKPLWEEDLLAIVAKLLGSRP